MIKWFLSPTCKVYFGLVVNVLIPETVTKKLDFGFWKKFFWFLQLRKSRIFSKNENLSTFIGGTNVQFEWMSFQNETQTSTALLQNQRSNHTAMMSSGVSEFVENKRLESNR